MRNGLQLSVWLLFLLTNWTTDADRSCPDGLFGERCLLHCRCADLGECDDVTGACSSGCAPGWSGRVCQRQNLAHGKNTTIRKSDDVTTGEAATDGDLFTCVSTKSNRTGWLKVDLNTTYSVYSMRLYTGTTSSRSWKIYVSDYEDLFWFSPCTVLRFDGTDTMFTCDTPVTGRYVGLMNKGAPVTVCEFEIFACADYTFGVKDCNSQCRCFNQSEICDPVHGTCSSTCPEGWSGSNCHTACSMTYGRNCVHRCGQCLEGGHCEVDTGRCTQGCSPGWTGRTCHIECPEGTYGTQCSETCAHCSRSTVCSTVSGACPKGCQVGWKGPKCDQRCNRGEYGANCGQQCGHCRPDRECDPNTGMCLSGCIAGWEGLFCNQECLPGKYGEDCLQSCMKCVSSTCDRHNGSCGEAGCQKGWSGDVCDFACDPGFYGPNCQLKCGHCSGDVICNPLNGTCGTSCSPGYHGDKCILTCPDGTWGDGCTKICGLCHRNEGCNPVTGLCDQGCFEGYHGTYCTEASEFRDRSSALVAPVMAISVAIVTFNLCLLFACLVFKWRRDEVNIPHAVVGTKKALLGSQPE